MEDADKRYEQIMQRIKARSNQQEHWSVLMQTMDALNATALLEELAAHRLPRYALYGPRCYSGDTWLSCVLWSHARRVSGYRMLSVMGIWVCRFDPTELIVGSRQLVYSAPVFNGEAYYKLIRQNYRTYYSDNGHPPDVADCLLHAIYHHEDRLDLRRRLQECVHGWLQTLV